MSGGQSDEDQEWWENFKKKKKKWETEVGRKSSEHPM